MPERPAPSQQIQAQAVLMFVLEVALLAAAALWAIDTFTAQPVVGVVLSFAVLLGFWMTFMSPKAPRPIRWPLHPLVALGLFLAASLALLSVGYPGLGAVFALLAVLNTVLSFRNRTGVRPAAVPAATGRRSRRR